MTISITITAETAEDARADMRKLLGEDVQHSGPAEQGFVHEVQKERPSSGKPDPRKDQVGSGDDTPPYPLEKLLGETIKVIKGKLPGLTAAELRDLADYEDDGKNRATLLKAIEDEIASRAEGSGDAGDEPDRGEDADDSEAKANTGLDDDDEQSDDTGLTGEGDSEPEAQSEDVGPSLEDCREIGRKVQRLDNGTEMLRELLADIGATNLSDAHAKDKGAAFVAGCEKILAEKGE